MTEDEVVDLLEFASNYDRRHLTDGETEAWHKALRLVDLDDAKEAVAGHYQRSDQRIMPSHVMNYLRPSASRHPSALPVPVRLAVPAALAGQGARRVAEAILAARSASEARRARVLRHPDLAYRLTQPPLNYERPEQWNGYVPPAQCHDEIPEAVHSAAVDGGQPNQRNRHTGATRPNTSPARAALVDICAEALKREQVSV